jgi:hypothetical protein
MSKILEKATAHFRDKISADMKYVVVPEWDNQKVYFKNAITLKEQSKLIDLASQGKQVEALVESLIVKARNEDGTKMFNLTDKPTLMNEVDPNIIIRLVAEINTVTEMESDLERVEKN